MPALIISWSPFSAALMAAVMVVHSQELHTSSVLAKMDIANRLIVSSRKYFFIKKLISIFQVSRLGINIWSSPDDCNRLLSINYGRQETTR